MVTRNGQGGSDDGFAFVREIEEAFGMTPQEGQARRLSAINKAEERTPSGTDRLLADVIKAKPGYADSAPQIGPDDEKRLRYIADYGTSSDLTQYINIKMREAYLCGLRDELRCSKDMLSRLGRSLREEGGAL